MIQPVDWQRMSLISSNGLTGFFQITLPSFALIAERYWFVAKSTMAFPVLSDVSTFEVTATIGILFSLFLFLNLLFCYLITAKFAKKKKLKIS